MNILAVDPGTHCGWASFSNGQVESGVQIFELGRGDSPGIRFLHFRAWLKKMFQLTVPSLVSYERPLLYGGYATDLLVGFVTRIQEECAEHSVACEAVHVSTLKKKATGSGRADKAAMIWAASERFGREIKDDNEADALMLLWVAMEEQGLQIPSVKPGDNNSTGGVS
jgi:Holliday junction resolvasome RuvABC endonuclease subunit